MASHLGIGAEAAWGHDQPSRRSKFHRVLGPDLVPFALAPSAKMRPLSPKHDNVLRVK